MLRCAASTACGGKAILSGGRLASGQGPLLGAVEGGGTKFVCAVAESPTSLVERMVVPTRDADSTLRECIDFFRTAAERRGQIAALGMACFGPLQLQRGTPNYGCLLG